jgi:hypothetical protein
MVEILKLPTAISQISPSHAGDEAKCSQPDLLRLLAISCLGKAIYDGPWFGAHDDQMNYCATITNVTQNIDTLTKEFNLPRLLRHVQGEYGANTGSLVSGLRYADGKLLVSRNGEESEITSSHIKGEAYEILCAIVFNCNNKTPLNIKNYYHELHENGENVSRQSNARIVKWSDGSLSLYLGNEIFDVYKTAIQGDHNHLFVRQGNVLHGQVVFKTKLTFRFDYVFFFFFIKFLQ